MAETPLTADQIAAQEAQAKKEGYLKREAVALDQFVSATADGPLDETISARSARAAAKGKWFGRFMVWWLDKIQPNHGEKAEAGDLARAESVEETEETSLGVKDQ